MANTEKFSKEGEQARRYYMGQRYGRAVLFGLAAGVSATLAVWSGGKALESVADSDRFAHDKNITISQNSSDKSISGRALSNNFNDAISNIDIEAAGFTALMALFSFSAIGAGFKTKEYAQRGNAHFRREHHYG